MTEEPEEPTEAELRGLERLQDTVHELAREYRQPPRPNLFDWAGMSDSELAHSQVLAHFLDPRADHGQGTRFLNTFVAMLAERGADTLSGVRCTHPSMAEVYTEYVIPSGRRIDVVMLLPPWGVIAIENKVWAGEQDKQVADYAEWAAAQPGREVVVFLTPGGRKSETGRGADSLVLLSYGDLSRWLRTAGWDTPPDVRWIVDQYATQCERIHAEATGGQMMDAEIPAEVRRRLFSDEGKLESTIQLANWLDRYHAQLRQDFWRGLENAVNEGLAERHLDSANWRVVVDPNTDVQWSGLSIFHGEVPDITEKKPYETGRYAIRLTQESGKLYFGVFRGQEVTEGKLTAGESAIREILADSYKLNNSWIGWKWAEPQKNLLVRDSENMLALHRAVHGANRTIRQLALSLVELVEKHGEAIAALDSGRTG